MKLNLLKKLAHKRQEKIVTKACVRYYSVEGAIKDETIDMLNGMLDRLQVEDEESVLSAIVFSEEGLNLKDWDKEPSIKYEKAKTKDSGSDDVANPAGASTDAGGSVEETEPADREG
jgi:hypothetical protein